jgi:sulfate permease, SulP family
MEETRVTERRGATSWLFTVSAGLIIGAVEAVLAMAFAALVFGGLLAGRMPDGIGLYMGAAALTLAFLAWRAGTRSVVGSVQDAPAAVLGVVAGIAAAKAKDLATIARQAGLKDYDAPDVFLTVVAATMVLTVLCGIVFLVLGRKRLGSLVRFVPYPVVGGFLAGTGWLLFKSGVNVSTGMTLRLRAADLGLMGAAEQLLRQIQWIHLIPALAFGVILLIAVRTIKRPLVIPAVIGIGLLVFAVAMVLAGSSLEEVRADRWLLGPFESSRLWQPWSFRAITGADWPSVIGSWAGILVGVFVGTIQMLFNVSGTELELDRDLDTNEELRDAGVLNVFAGVLGGVPGYHALSLTALADRMKVDARAAGLIAATVPLAAVLFGATVVGLIPRMIVGGVLVFLGLAFIVEWLWDKRHVLPRREYWVVWVILIGVMAWGFLVGVVLGLVLAVLLFAISYGRVELVREVPFGATYHSNVDRPAEERAELRTAADRVQILRISGFVFFGSTSRLLDRIRRRIEETPLRFLVIDLRRVTGVDSSAVVSFVKVIRLAEAHGFDVIFTGASEPVRAQLARGDVAEIEGLVTFEADLDRGLQRCEDALLGEPGLADAKAEHPAGGSPDGLPQGLAAHLEHVALDAGDVLLHQDDPPGDVFVLASGRLDVETTTPEGTRMRLRTLRPGVVVGEVTLYTGVARTADVVAGSPVVVLRIGRDTIERLEREEPELAAQLHRWLATTLAERLTDTIGAVDALLD